MITKEIAVIPDFTTDDYYNTSKPYEFLYSFANDKFVLSQMREKMKAAAASAGVKGFMALWNTYLETLQSQRGIVMDNCTEFEGQEMELLSGQYICNEYGITVVDKYGYDKTICRHPIMPVQRLVNVDNGEERLRLAYKKGRQWRSAIVEKTTIASSSGILGLAANGIMVNSENAKELSTYIMEMEQLNYDLIEEQKSVSRLGWVGEHGFSPYMDSLIFDGDRADSHIFNAVCSQGSFDKWKDITLGMRASSVIGRIILATSFASVLIEPCGLLPFILHIWGGTENGKSVGLMIAASVWANPKMGEYITTFNSTAVGQEMTAGMLNSLPMCIDELQIQSSAGIRDFDKQIYQLTEGVGKKRGAKNGGVQKTVTWRNCFITNGEHPITSANSGGGAVNRIIEIECKEKIFPDLPGLCAVIRENYGYAGKRFVEFLQLPGGIEAITVLQREYYRELLRFDSTEKQAAAASAILAADDIVTEIIFKDGRALTVEDFGQIMTKRSDVDANARAHEYVKDLVSMNPNKFKANDYGDYQNEVWGRIEGDYALIIKSVFDRELSAQGFNSAAYLSWAKRMGLLQASGGENETRNTKRCRITGSAVHCVCVRVSEPEATISTINPHDCNELCNGLPN